jgi:crossover junction endodeoxyribonuclease RuvC
MRILGIDPGLTGGVAIYDTDLRAVVDAIDIEIVGEDAKQRVGIIVISNFIHQYKAGAAFIERAGVMPKQGIASGFKYGRAVGAIEAVVILAGVPLTLVEPQTWKRFYQLVKADKEASRRHALRLFPYMKELLARKKDHGRAEAMLIALYGARIIVGGGNGRIALPISCDLC